jgi:hypothetical protein
MDALPKAEYEELLQLNQKVEELNAKRIGCLAELSILWKKPLQDVMDKLGIKTPSYD